MTLTAGQSLSFYEILGPLGVGAMGEVYRAKDTRLDREVAIKVLPEHFADDEERLRRFEREAKSLASLNHPNVAQIFGVDQVEDTCFLVLELVPGETLEDRIARSALPVDEAIDVCRQIAEGLEAAHEAGVIHRDLKPANVRITPDGKVKVLDFGLAKLTGPDKDSAAATDSVLSTEQGRLLGTPTYMAPEQARGKPIDRRVDVWAFGCVLYECLSAKRAFAGETLSDVLAAVLEKEPDWSALPRLPGRLDELLRRTLTKDPHERLRDVGEARVLLSSPLGLRSPAETSRTSGAGWLVALVLGLVIGVVSATIFIQPETDGGGAPGGTLALSVHLPSDELLTAARLPNLVVSPDGRTVAWVGGAREEIHVRSLDSYEARVLVGTEGGGCPFFCPDGQWIGFIQEGALKKIALSGGRPVVITELGDLGGQTQAFRGASWGEDGWIVMSPTFNTGLSRVRAEGGAREELVALDPESDERTLRWPHLVPGWQVVLYTRDDSLSQDYYDDAAIVARSLETNRAEVIVQGASMARYADGQVVFARGGSLFAVRFDPETLTTSGEPIEVLSGVETDRTSGAVQFALARDGSLAYAPGGVREAALRLAWRDRDSVELLDLPPGSYRYPRLSTDGSRLAYIFAEPDASSVWVHDFARGTSTPQMRRGDAVGITWSPDDTRIYFGAVNDDGFQGLHSVEVDSGHPPELVFGTDSGFLAPIAFLPGGERIVSRSTQMGAGLRVLAYDFEADEVEVLLESPNEDRGAALHPGGDWIAYTSNRTGRFEVYLVHVGPGPTLPQVSRDGGLDPVWSRDGRRLFFVKPAASELWAVDVELSADPGSLPTLGVPYLYLADFFHRGSVEFTYDVGLDGRVLTLIDSLETEVGREIRVLPGWLTGLR